VSLTRDEQDEITSAAWQWWAPALIVAGIALCIAAIVSLFWAGIWLIQTASKAGWSGLQIFYGAVGLALVLAVLIGAGGIATYYIKRAHVRARHVKAAVLRASGNSQ
jgi:hypothetical protein